ncbi:hypothetical protein [Aporhodopirellula aestuarii]|uniref:Uncharacterized protein n=1 Tax=Aporhodopirellula aestuarii TaxID=2950107 RepID=A0ABT0U4D5_9BACT|nr:hypothetical protein [Aporhodopirellula aestuarii]MCM2371791.1 hypothetical protein [Aporhodopirellula aestuarii]
MTESPKQTVAPEVAVGRRYYAEVLDGLPFGMMVGLLRRTIPLPFAFGITLSFRIRKWLGLSPLPAYGFGGVGCGTDLSREKMPSRPMSRWAGWFEDLGDLGFTPLRFCVGDYIGAKESASTVWIDSSRNTFACLEWFRMPGASGIEERSSLEFNSIVRKKSRAETSPVPVTEVMTAMIRESDMALQDAFKLNYIDTVFFPDSEKLKSVYLQHHSRLANYSALVQPDEVALQTYDRLSQGRLDCIIELGLVRELTPAEIREISKNRLE